jgi:hypothetical protein
MFRHVTPVELEVDGTRLQGFYSIQSNMLTVWHAHLGSRTVQVDGNPLREHVDALMRELFEASRRRNSAVGFAERRPDEPQTRDAP